MDVESGNGISHIKHNNQQIGYFVYYTRETGRFSNQLYEYIYWRLKAINDGVQFENTYKTLPFPFNNIPSSAYDRKKKLKMFEKKAPSSTCTISCEYFTPHRNVIQNILKIEQFPLDIYDIVVHVRLDDIFHSIDTHSLLPLSFYEFIEAENVLIIGNPINDEQHVILDRIRETIMKKSKNVAIQKDGDISKDIVSIMSCKELVASISGFWFWPAFISDNIEKVHVPLWGINRICQLDKWDKVVVHDVKLGYKIGKLCDL